MERWEEGMLARSLAGHDKEKVYVMTKIEDAYVYLSDGKNRKTDNPKKKKKKHVQLIRIKHEINSADDEKVRRLLKEYSKSLTGRKEES